MTQRDLWDGADVRYIGPERDRRGVRLAPGETAVVVDAGRHHVSSFGTLYFPAGSRRARPSRDVLIRSGDGSQVSVPRKHLEVIPPDHPLRPEPDGAVADWWLEQLAPWGSQESVPVGSLVPASFPAVAQVLHPWWDRRLPEGGPIRWRELAERYGFGSVRALDASREMHSIPLAQDDGLSAFEGELDDLTAATLVELLGDATTTRDEVFVAVWTGWGDVPPHRFPGAAHLDTQARGHFLLRGSLAGVLTSVSAAPFGRPAAGLWWPADRAWFVATEIDFEWTFVAGSDDIVDRLLGDDRLEVARTSFDAPANQAAEPG